MELYSNTELQTGAAAPKSYNVGNKSLGVSITNYSNLAFVLSSDKQANVGNVPPFFTVNLPVAPGEILYFTQGAPTQAVAQSAMFCSISESQSQTTPSQTPLAQVPGYVQNVSGTVSMAGIGQVTIQNTPEVTFAAGQSVNIGNIAAGTVNVQNTPGSPLNVGGTVTVGNTSLQVQNTSGGTLNVAGTVQIGNTPSVQIANTVNAAITSGSVNATIQNANLNTAVTNAQLSTTNLFVQPETDQTITNLAAGATLTIDYYLNALVLGDEMFITAFCPNASSTKYQYTLSLIANKDIPYSHTYSFSPLVDIGGSPGNNYAQVLHTNITPAFIFNHVRLIIKNISGATIASDLIKLFFDIKYASVKNVADTITYFLNQYSGTLVPAGGLLKKLSFMIQNQESTPKSVVISNGGQIVASIVQPGSASGSTVSNPFNYDFGNGVTNNGVTVTVSGTAGAAWVTGYGLT